MAVVLLLERETRAYYGLSHQRDNYVDDMRVQIFEKIYYYLERLTLRTSFSRIKELFWIKELGTAKPYGFNDEVKGFSTLSSISCKKINVYSLFNEDNTQETNLMGKGTTIKELLCQM